MAETSKQPRFTKEAYSYYRTLFWFKDEWQLTPPRTIGSRPRDSWLSELWKQELHMSGVVSSVAALDANRGWSLEGGRNQVYRYTPSLHSWRVAPGLKGWRAGCVAMSTGFSTTDLGGLAEIGRKSRNGPMRSIYHLDPTKCELTLDNEFPLTYWGGGTAVNFRELDFIRAVSMPDIREELGGLGFCPLSRALPFTQIMMAIFAANRERLGVDKPKGLLLLQNIDEAQWDSAMAGAESDAKEKGYNYYQYLAVIATMGGLMPDAKLISLANLPDNFSMNEWLQNLMYGYALCFNYDPSEFYPVQYGALGRGTEVETQHEKATGKGGRSFVMALQEQLQRDEVIPDTLQFEFDERDDDTARIQAEVDLAWQNLFKSMRETGMVMGEPGLTNNEYRVLCAQKNLIPEEWTLAEETVTGTDEQLEPDAEMSISLETEDVYLSEPSLSFDYLTEQQKNIRRCRLLEKPKVLRALANLDNDPLIRYSFKSGKERELTLWPDKSSLKTPQFLAIPKPRQMAASREYLPRAQHYDKGGVTITDDDVTKALDAAKGVSNNLYDLLIAKRIEV